jgi:hypothetical protein
MNSDPHAGAELPERVEPLCSVARAGRSGIVKVSDACQAHRREGMLGGRRPKSLEGGNRGGVRDGGGVDLWDLAPVLDVICPLQTGTKVE